MVKKINTVEILNDGLIKSLPAEPLSWPQIFQVPHFIRKLNEAAYEPRIISIGPYHRGKEHLKPMETLKLRFLNDCLQRDNDSSAKRYEMLMTSMMKEARNFYAKSLVISDKEFLDMMVLDGCFIAELIHKIRKRSLLHDPIFRVEQITENILKDFTLVENQLPFFVLWELFGNMFGDPSPYIVVILDMFEGKMPGLRVSEGKRYNRNSVKNVKHLVDLLRTNWLPSEEFLRGYVKWKLEDEPRKKTKEEKEDASKKTEEVEEDNQWLRSATELREAGIKFQVKKVKKGSLFDIEFENGKLSIPFVRIDDDTEGLFRNIIACEQFDYSGSPKYLTQYREVMDCLINTGKDVQLLCRKRIIDNWLGTDDAVAEMFNTLGSEVILDRNNFFYEKLLIDVRKHYYTTWNKRKASLRHNYFNTPWALFSFLAAAFLLLLTLLQTIFTIIPRS
ncbi:hypothetical protein SLEP1_g52384 [Rubroshorea leprosula]|uniref:Uncharacterized protein n=1 Tax=Rubroshorea leprosula TaxID=152421 RepID=A0AAV5M628_9ROSI|nr:hypothetical protein SLEP1_g52384 [Rubroshorea leprosula]